MEISALTHVLHLRMGLYAHKYAHVYRVITFTAVIQLMKQQVRYICKWRSKFNSVDRNLSIDKYIKRFTFHDFNDFSELFIIQINII